MATVRRVRGLPLIGGLPVKALFQQPIFVDSNTGSDDNDGTNPEQPLATLADAFDSSKVGTNGIVIVLPGHSESVTAAAGIDADIAGVHVLGLGEGSGRPTFNVSTATTADIDIDAANITFENMVFDLTGIDAVAGGIDVNAANFTLKKSEVVISDGSGQAVVGVLGDANADDLTVEDCLFRGSADAGPAACIRIIGSDHPVIKNNILYGDFSVSPIENVTTACTRVFIEGNDMDNYNANDFGITLVATTDGSIRYNTIRVATNGQVTFITAGNDCQLYENYGVNADGETGMLEGTTSS